MWNCPVCDSSVDLPICPECGFDRSTDLLHFPTFCPVGVLPASPTALREDRQVLTCPECGGTGFSFRLKRRSWYCLKCRAELTAQTALPEIELPEPRKPVSLAAGGYHSVLLWSDGTVTAVGDNSRGQCDVADWTDVTAVAAGYFRTVGLRADGTILAAGSSDYGQCRVEDLTKA